MKDLSIYPFKILRKKIYSLVIPLIPILFLLVSIMLVTNEFGLDQTLEKTDFYFGGLIYLSTSDLTQYDNIGGDGLIPIIRLGGITKGASIENFDEVYNEFITMGLTPAISIKLAIFLTLFLAYLCYAMISRRVSDLKKRKESYGVQGINPPTIILSLIAAFLIMFISSFSLQGFQLVLLLNLCVFFALWIPHAAAGASLGESIYRGFNFFRFNLRGLITLYLLCMGVAIAVPVGLLLVFMFPISVLNISILPAVKLILFLFGITFTLYYQFVVCSRAALDFNRPVETKLPAFKTRMARKVR